MEKLISQIPEQLFFKPEIKNAKKLEQKKYFVIFGMGGSHLAADLLKIINPKLNVFVISDYNLPNFSFLKESLLVFCSFSGNTEEVIGALKQAREKKLPSIVISGGGELIKLAKKLNIPYIEIPKGNLVPRLSYGLFLKAFLLVVGDRKNYDNLEKLFPKVKKENNLVKKQGKQLARLLKGYIPIIYSSFKNKGLGYHWKIKFNENAKVPAFLNVFPELNHNEIIGFSFGKFCFLFLEDESDDLKIKKRMKLTKKILQNKNFLTKSIALKGDNLEKIFNNLILADWTSYFLAKERRVDPVETKLIEDFKKRLGR